MGIFELQFIFSALLACCYIGLLLYQRRLSIATKEYAETTKRLFELNRELLTLGRESLEQSKKGFLVNLINETMYDAMELKLRGKAVDYFLAHARGVYSAVKSIDPGLADALKKGWCRWGEDQRWIENKTLWTGLQEILERK